MGSNPAKFVRIKLGLSLAAKPSFFVQAIHEETFLRKEERKKALLQVRF